MNKKLSDSYERYGKNLKQDDLETGKWLQRGKSRFLLWHNYINKKSKEIHDASVKQDKLALKDLLYNTVPTVNNNVLCT